MKLPCTAYLKEWLNIRHESTRIFWQAKPPKCNLLGQEVRALKDFSRANNIITLPANKVSATVLNTGDYNWKIEEMLDKNTYKKIPRDTTASMAKKTDLM